MTGQLSWYRRMRGGPDLASCMEVGRALQSYLDGHVDDLTAQRVTRHLELCRRCGMKAETYADIKASLARRGPAVDPEAVARLRAFGDELLERDSGPDSEGPEQA
jgi:anti-sigma factor RsiW